MGLYEFSRIEGFPSLFAPNKTPVTADTVEAGWIFAFLILFASFLVILPGFRGKRRFFVLVRVTASIIIGLLLMLGNFGMEWEVATLKTRTPYKAYTSAELEGAEVGMKLGLRGVNVTLYVDQDHIPMELKGEVINYNERFWWSWGQGRNGFGPFAGQIQRDFRRAQQRGAPLPILWVAEYFTFDGEGIRFGRHYMRAGWYAHILIWAAFPCYLLANIFQFMVLRYAALFTMMTGLLQIIACIIWAAVRNPVPLVVPFEEGVLRTRFGAHFYLTLINGIFCLLVGLTMIFMDIRYPEYLTDFFGVDPLQDYEEHYYTQEELETETKGAKESAPGTVELGSITKAAAAADANSEEAEPGYLLKRRSHLPGLQRSSVRRPEAAPRRRYQAGDTSIREETEQQENLYENTR
ncbi:dual oxidase maturation factor 1-like [Amphibalanus amphitrite]|uniref:dual oxidase maturation factor 1-like n=1 Tax=Amphibalanus amphitrite TaxID=1232801 RepID=UPI001C90260A|nr:dual oxidase maturation factor 1-like [Amphibalanus amphitrite]